ncbi:MAG: peroxiredoxin [Alphaproteobacteria bacterium]|nr:peroxiredoxin [Alphaproteobacteria bacterium]
MSDGEFSVNANRMPLIGDAAPEFSASTTNGPINFPRDFAGKWVVLFSHPSDFTPVCTSEFVAFQRDIEEFAKLNTQLVGLSVGALSSHLAWLDTIAKMPNGVNITFPLIDDLSMSVARQYGMIHPHSSSVHAVRAVFIIDTGGIIRAILYYPATLGRNMGEIRRILTGLQTADAFGVALPANWQVGDDVLALSPTTADAVRQHRSKTPWFITYSKLGKDVIYSKIGKSKSGKK